MQRHLLVSTKARYKYKLQPLITSPGGKGIRAGLGLTKVMALSIQQVSSPSAINRFLWIPKHIHVVWPLQCLMVTSCRHAQFIKAVQFYSKSSVCHNPRIPSTRQEITESSISLDMYISCCMFCFILQFSPPKTWKAVLSIVIYSCIMESSSEAFYGRF